MTLRLFMAATILVASPFFALAETDEPHNQTPKPTIAEAQKLVETISGDQLSSKLTATPANSKSKWTMQWRERDEKVLSNLVAKMDGLQADLGPEFKKVSDGLEGVEPNSAEGKEIC
jgi:hypothetical protein